MIQNHLRRLAPLAAMLVASFGGAACSAYAAVLYSQNFESPVPLSSNLVGPAGFVQVNDVSGTAWQIQGGGGAGGISLLAGVDANGSGGDQSLSATWDHTPAAPGFFTYNQYTLYGLPGPGAGVAASQVKISMDLFIDGSTINNPLEVVFQSNGDMIFTPTLTNGAYTSVSYTLNQTTGGAFDPTASFNIKLQHGANGFGFDAGNIVRIDNISVEVIPEPATFALTAAAGVALISMRRRRS